MKVGLAANGWYFEKENDKYTDWESKDVVNE